FHRVTVSSDSRSPATAAAAREPRTATRPPRRTGGLQVDVELEFGRLLDRQVAGRAPLRIRSTKNAPRYPRSGPFTPYPIRPPACANRCRRSMESDGWWRSPLVFAHLL